MFSFSVKLLLVILRFAKDIGKSYKSLRLTRNDGENQRCTIAEVFPKNLSFVT